MKVKEKVIKYQEFVEIIPNFWIGSKMNILKLITSVDIDVLVPLDDLSPKVWEVGYFGQIDYCPIEDYGTLPINMETIISNRIVENLKNGKKVALFCYGGKGRTGYLASIVLRKMCEIYHEFGVIGFLRENYNNEAVESLEQVYRCVEEEHRLHWKKEIEDRFFWFNDFYENYDHYETWKFDKKGTEGDNE